MISLLLASALAGDCQLERGVYLLTMSPGDDVQTIFGHTALLIYDPEQGEYAPVYDYGRFHQDPPLTMAWEVLRMEKEYFMGSRTLAETVAFYDRRQRGIVAQRLALSEAETTALSQRLATDLNGELHFDYNWYRPNCTTMIQERLDGVLDGALRSQLGARPGPSPAGEVLRHAAEHLPLWFGLHWGSGAFAHTPVSLWDGAFLPDTLRASLGDARHPSAGPLVTDTCILGAVSPEPVVDRGPSRNRLLWLLGALWAALVAAAGRVRRTAGVGVVAAQGLAVGLFGAAAVLVGSLGTFAPFWGHHNLTLANPAHLALLGAAWLSWRAPSSRVPAAIGLGLAGLTLLGMGAAVQGANNLGLVGLLLPPTLAAAWVLRPLPGA